MSRAKKKRILQMRKKIARRQTVRGIPLPFLNAVRGTLMRFPIEGLFAEPLFCFRKPGVDL